MNSSLCPGRGLLLIRSSAVWVDGFGFPNKTSSPPSASVSMISETAWTGGSVVVPGVVEGSKGKEHSPGQSGRDRKLLTLLESLLLNPVLRASKKIRNLNVFLWILPKTDEISVQFTCEICTPQLEIRICGPSTKLMATLANSVVFVAKGDPYLLKKVEEHRISNLSELSESLSHQEMMFFCVVCLQQS